MILSRRFLVACVLVALLSFFLSFFLSFLAVDLNAQLQGCFRPQNCSEVAFDVFELPKSHPAYCLNANEDACGKHVYGVYLIIIPSQKQDYPVQLDYLDLDFYAALTEVGQPDVLFSGQSTFDMDLTTDCNKQHNFNGSLIVDEKSVNYHLNSGKQTGAGPCVGIANPIWFYSQSTLIGTVVVDAFPGEEFDLDITATSLSFTIDGVGDEVCEGLGTVTTISEPLAPDPDQNRFLELVMEKTSDCVVVVKLKNNGSTAAVIEDLDFALTMMATNSMENPQYLGGIFGIDINRIAHNSSNHTWYVNVENGMSIAPNSEQTLFSFSYDHPINQSLLTTMQFNFGQARVKTPLECSRLEVDNNGVSCIHNGSDPCVDSPVTFTVSPKTVSASCDELHVLVGIGPGENQPNYPYTVNISELILDLDFAGSQGVHLSSISNGWPLPNVGQIQGNNFTYSYSGFGFPVEFDHPDHFYYIDLTFAADQGGCVGGVTVTQSQFTVANADPCVFDLRIDNGFPLCVPEVITHVMRGDYIKDALVKYESSCYVSGLTECAPFASCVKCMPAQIEISASKNDDWLLGVNTFDLWIIRRMIAFTGASVNQFMQIAADANKDGIILSSDVDYLRGYLVGAISQVNSPSPWVFIDLTSIIPDPDGFPNTPSYTESIVVNPNYQNNPAAEASLRGVFLGDVDESAPIGCPKANQLQSTQVSSSLSIFDEKTEIYKLDVLYSGKNPAVALQMDINFDLSNFDFLQVDKGSVPFVHAKNFNTNEAEDGHIRFIWFDESMDEPYSLKEGAVLFTILLQKKKGQEARFNTVLKVNETVDNFQSLAFSESGEAFRLEYKNTVDERRSAESLPSVAKVFPNPTHDGASLQFELQQSGRIKCFLFSAFGKTEQFIKLELPKGAHTLSLDKLKDLPAGIYTYILATPDGVSEGKIIKQ